MWGNMAIKTWLVFLGGLHGYKSKINVFHTDSNRLHGIKFDCYLDARLRGSTVDFTSEQFGCRSTTASEISGGLGGAWVFSVGKATLKFLPWAMTYSVAAPVEGFRNAWFQWNDSQMFVDNTRVLIEPCDSLDMWLSYSVTFLQLTMVIFDDVSRVLDCRFVYRS